MMILRNARVFLIQQEYKCFVVNAIKNPVVVFFKYLKVARSVAAQSSISFNQPSPAAIAVYSHVRHQPSQNAEVQSSSVLNRAKYEILHIIGLMIEKTQQEVVDLLPDVSRE